MAARSYGQYCGLTTAVELIGERWALLIVRDLLVGARRYTDLKNGLPRIPTNILSARLKELQDSGVVRRVPIARCGLVYELTEYGRELEPIVVALGRWGFQRMGDPKEGDVVTADSLTMALRTAFVASAAASMPHTAYELHVADVVLRADVVGEGLTVTQLAPPAPPVGGEGPSGGADIVIVAGPGIREVISGEVSAEEAVENGIAHIVSGDPALLGRFARTFHIDPGPALAA